MIMNSCNNTGPIEGAISKATVNNSNIEPLRQSEEIANPKNRFQQLWEKAENIREETGLLEESLDALVARVRKEVLPQEQELGLALRQQTYKLITFSSRKSLAQWERSVLEQWIANSLDAISQFGLIDSELRDHLAAVQAQELNIQIDENSDVSVADQLVNGLNKRIEEEGDLSQSQSSFNDELNDEFDFEAELQDIENDMNDFKSWYDEQVGAAGLDHEDELHGAAGDNDKMLEGNSALLKTWFHRAARAIHPDKVTDPKEKEKREVVMAQLLEARRTQDLMSLFGLYREYVDSDADFSEHDLKELEDVLVQFIVFQRQKQSDLIMQTPEHQMAYEFFHSKSSAAVTRKIKRHLKEIRCQIVEVESFSTSVTSLKKLKPYLDLRYEELVQSVYFDTF